MALICSRHSFEYAENVCSSCGIAFCHDCLVYPRGPKKPPLCVACAIAAAGVRSSARNHSNLSRREVKKRVREAKGLQQPQPYVEAPAAANTDRDFELTSNATFDQGWAVSWDEGRDPHPGYPEPVRVSWGTDPFANRDAAPAAAPFAPTTAAPAPPAPAPASFELPAEPTFAAAPGSVVETAAEADFSPARPPDLPRLQQAELAHGHAPVRPGGLPSVRPPIKPAGAQPPVTTKLARPPQPESAGTAPRPDADAASPPAAPPSGRLRRNNEKEDSGDGAEMIGWIDGLLEKGHGQGPSGPGQAR
jgi:hypothetical protein